MPGVRKSDPLADSTRSLQKGEVIVLHRTLFRLRRDLEALGRVPAGAFEAYDKLGVHPLHINRARGAHRAAVQLLTEGFRRCVTEDQRDTSWRRL